MKPADDYADLGSNDPRLTVLACWEAYSAETKVDHHSSALGVDGQLYFVDPILLQRELLDELAQPRLPPPFYSPTATTRARPGVQGALLHSDLRARAMPGRNWGSIWTANSCTRAVAELNAFEVVALPGGAAGEVAIYLPLDGGIVVVGDALINLQPYGFSLLPDKYCADPKELRRSLKGLLEYSFEKMLFAHGTPIMSGARRKLEALLAS